jgi:hypothetical protein
VGDVINGYLFTQIVVHIGDRPLDSAHGQLFHGFSFLTIDTARARGERRLEWG